MLAFIKHFVLLLFFFVACQFLVGFLAAAVCCLALGFVIRSLRTRRHARSHRIPPLLLPRAISPRGYCLNQRYAIDEQVGDGSSGYFGRN